MSVTLQQKAKGDRPQYFADPAIDKNLSITLALAGEVAVLRDRLDSIERLMEAGQPISRAAVDAYVPPVAVRAERDQWREQYLATVLRIVHQEREELAARAAEMASAVTAYEEAVAAVEND
ncbi:hypothetical protein [Polymorphobacter sp.]|uniref:hypothetical protein n=1 Tax=Polymorphobacter sp. TaxID=1909290 RepID=UPI003F6EE74F